jgi:MoaA/NifB/PqqE/SkfB family radical SAM enzyme
MYPNEKAAGKTNVPTSLTVCGVIPQRECAEAPPLRLVFWETTTGCNLECSHCRRLEVSRELPRNDLSTQESLNFIRSLPQAGRPILVFSGGEPLMRPDIFDLVLEARRLGLSTALATNRFV